jgi:hypothetical protein
MSLEYNIRQLKLILKNVENCKNEKISLNTLIVNVEALLNCLENFDLVVKDQMVEQWGELEITYSIVASEERKTFTDDEERRVFEALKNIENIVTAQINNEII